MTSSLVSTPPPAATIAGDRARIDDLAIEIVGYAGRLSAVVCSWLLLIARLDAAEGCRWLGFPSTAHWLAYACGLSKRTADDHVRSAQALAAFPALTEAMAAGRLSYSHVRAIARLAEPGETRLVDDLIEIAKHGTVAHLESVVRGLRTVEDNRRREDGWVPENYVRCSWTQDSAWRLSSRLDPEKGALVEAAIKAVAAKEGIDAPAALIRMAEIALAHTNDATTGRSELRGDEKAAVVIHLNPNDLGSAQPSPSRPMARIANGPGLPDSVVKRLICAGRIRTVVRDGPNVLDVGRSHRLVTAKQYRALMIRDEGHCQHPGCTNTRDLDAHHVIHWLDGGRTDLNNLILLCQPHHLAHHNNEFAITADQTGHFTFTRGDGTALPDRPNPADYSTHYDPWTATTAIHQTAATTHWDGQRLQHDYAISVLAQRRESA